MTGRELIKYLLDGFPLDQETGIDGFYSLPNQDRIYPMAKITGNTSDGYHTFDELYAHRTVLFAVICNQNHGISWRSKLHNDGTMFEGMFIAGMDLPYYGQVTYHCEDKYWDLFNGSQILLHAPAWDGHQPNDVIERMTSYRNIEVMRNNQELVNHVGLVAVTEMAAFYFNQAIQQQYKDLNLNADLQKQYFGTKLLTFFPEDFKRIDERFRMSREWVNEIQKYLN
ncbi:MAG: hypothetical protein K0R00_93 [Herbinix sp.]|jgi:hypothetical protein|nr:hypothetical protein [Herbinix sp.]